MARSKILSALAFGFFLVFPAGTANGSPDMRDSRGLEGFIDGVMKAQEKAHHFAGAVVVVVGEGHVLFEKGYGFADFAERKPVDPRRTLFRVGSNSKMFVWTAVMQLVEQGKLDLHTDVNQYLKGVQVPPAFGEPITLEHLMTHTPGFEDRVVGLFAKTPDALRPLAELMKRDMPARVFPPGKVTAYSNYGTALAALIVEQVSGLPYDTYLQDRIFAPLQMTHATIRQPVPATLAADVSKGYQWTEGRLKEQPFEYVPWAPVGAMSVSGEDMGRFMMAQLADGALGESRILRPETARRMRQRLTSFSPKINGMLHGFMEVNWNGETIYGHGGDTLWFHSFTAMLPARNLGIFVAYNTDTAAPAVQQFFATIFDHYFPSALPKEAAAPKEKRESLKRFTGTYSPSRVSESDLTKVGKLTGAASVQVDPDGYLVTRSGGEVVRWRQIEPLMFAQVDGKRRLVFRENERGEVTDLCRSPICIIAMLKQPWWDSWIPQLTWLGVSLAVLGLAFFGFPIAAVLQRKQAKPAGAKLARLAAWTTSLLLLAGMVALVAGLSEPNEILFGPPAAVRAGLTIWVACALLSIALLGFTVVAWRRRWWRVAGRVCITLVCTAAVALVAWLYHWNLLGWRYS